LSTAKQAGLDLIKRKMRRSGKNAFFEYLKSKNESLPETVTIDVPA
jgi:hypothetical protein